MLSGPRTSQPLHQGGQRASRNKVQAYKDGLFHENPDLTSEVGTICMSQRHVMVRIKVLLPLALVLHKGGMKRETAQSGLI